MKGRGGVWAGRQGWGRRWGLKTGEAGGGAVQTSKGLLGHYPGVAAPEVGGGWEMREGGACGSRATWLKGAALGCSSGNC